MADSSPRDGVPPFEEPFTSGDIEHRIYGTLLQTREPTDANAVADDVGCDPKTARKYLDWFAELGIAHRFESHPATFVRNDSYFEWRRINRLSVAHSMEELQKRITELSETIHDYEQAYGTSTPGGVDAIEVAERSSETNIDDVYGDLGDWETALRERRRCERARQQRSTQTEQASG